MPLHSAHSHPGKWPQLLWEESGKSFSIVYICHEVIGSFFPGTWLTLQSTDSESENWLWSRNWARDHDPYWGNHFQPHSHPFLPIYFVYRHKVVFTFSIPLPLGQIPYIFFVGLIIPDIIKLKIVVNLRR